MWSVVRDPADFRALGPERNAGALDESAGDRPLRERDVGRAVLVQPLLSGGSGLRSGQRPGL